jgi:hypothetical protein
MKRRALLVVPALTLLCAGCLNVKVQPIHVVVDVNVKVERALDDFFGDLDKKSATLNLPHS